MKLSLFHLLLLGLKSNALLLLLIVFESGVVLGAPLDGKKIYEAKCVSCHGPNGAGIKGKYNKPLSGDLTPNQLAKVIEETMPKEDPVSYTHLRAHET
jgi:cytochrome c553